MKIFVICSKGLYDKGLKYTREKEIQGHDVFFPLRDTKQVATTANAVVHSNLRGIQDVDEVHLLWDGSSFGTICFSWRVAYEDGIDNNPSSRFYGDGLDLGEWMEGSSGDIAYI